MDQQTRPPNRSIPGPAVTPILAYPDVREAVAWLHEVFGFTERLQIANHRAQMIIEGSGAVVVAEYIDRERRPAVGADHVGHQIMVRVPDVLAHHAHAKACGATILREPTDHDIGERQYVVRDPGGHRWIFSQTLADVHPNEWGDAEVVLKVP